MGLGARRRCAASIPNRNVLVLSELLPTRSRTFQLAHQLAVLTQGSVMDRIVAEGRFSTDESRGLAKVTLANYFAGAVLMPYAPFLQAAKEERYDIDVLGRRFRVGFEQVCHRLTTLRRPGAEGVPFHMMRIDVAGNISKRFSASGIRFARFSGACPRWNIFAAFLTPGMIRIQVSRMPDGEVFFCLARTIQKDSGGYHAQHPVQAIGLGCRVEHARELVYSDGIDVEQRRHVHSRRRHVPPLRAHRLRTARAAVAAATAADRRERARRLALRAGEIGLHAASWPSMMTGGHVSDFGGQGRTLACR